MTSPEDLQGEEREPLYEKFLRVILFFCNQDWDGGDQAGGHSVGKRQKERPPGASAAWLLTRGSLKTKINLFLLSVYWRYFVLPCALRILTSF